jgi:alkylation response protein AidB-like acyl-CoA dehydrogenase
VADIDALWAMARRNVTLAERTGGPPGGGSVFKLAYSEARHRLGDLALEILGRAGLALDGPDGAEAADHVRGWYQALSLTIAAGTSQIQRNIIAERQLGMPKEPR